MKRILLCGLLLIAGAVLGVCAQSTVLSVSLQFENANDLATAPPEGWSFENCSLKLSGTKYFVQVGNEGTGGSVTTQPLAGLTGNANIVMLVNPVSADYEFSISVVGEGELNRITYKYPNINSWQRACPFLLKNANAETRIVFSGRNFKICNIEVTDIGDAVFYESFNRCKGKYGQEGNFGFEGTEFTNSNLDNPLSTVKYDKITAGNGCVFFQDKGYFYTPAIPVSETGGYILTFKLAGYHKEYKEMAVSFARPDLTTLKVSINEIPQQTWGDFSVLIPEMIPSGDLRFDGRQCFLDELKVYEVKPLSMDESSSEASVAAEWQNKTVCMSLTRTFQKDIWNTCCLPFDFNASLLRTAAGDGALSVELRHLSDITSEGIFHFESVSSIPAGEPFLLKVSETVTNPVFRNVVVKALEPVPATSSSAPGYAFAGCYGKTVLETDGTHVFIGTDGLLHHPSPTGNTMRGLRAYMVLPTQNASRGLVFDERPTFVDRLPASSSSSADVFYSLSGQRVQNPACGLYVKNGKKIIISRR